jgi:YD repeat-containing protein
MTYHKSSPATKLISETEDKDDENPLAFGTDLCQISVMELTQSTEEGDANRTLKEYDNRGLLTALKSGNTKIEYEYDTWGRKTQIKVGDYYYSI